MLTNEQLDILAAELRDDPLGRGYAAMDDHQAADDLNTSYRDWSVPIEVSELEFAMRSGGKWDDFQKRASDRTTNPNMAELMDTFTTRIPEADLRGAQNKADKFGAHIRYWSELLDRCQLEGSLGAVAAEAMKALCDDMQSRAMELVDRRVFAADVERARAK